MNPYTPLLYANLGQGVQVEEFSAAKLIERYGVWHVHWPEAFLNIRNPLHAASKVAGFFAALDCLQMRGAKLVWTIHNCSSHEKLYPTLEAWFWRRFIPRVDGVISLSSAGLSSALDSFPALKRVPWTVIPHGHYRSEYPAVNGGARRMLGIAPEAKMLLFIGAVRSYKNVTSLVRVFRQIAADDALLHVVGRPNCTNLAQTILDEASSDNRVRVRFEFLAPEDLSAYVSAADVVVLPYREILNSGSALLALSLNRPILVPDRGAMGELKEDFGDKWVRTFSGELDKTVLEGAMAWALQSRPPVCPIPEKYEWPSIGRETACFYQRVISKSLLREA
jgi:beta-1,4-mannosyltransferase